MRLFPFWIALIAGINIYDDASKSRPFNWTNLWAAFGMLVFAGFLYLIMRLIFKLVLRYTEHDDRVR